jgi:hypothetical protein
MYHLGLQVHHRRISTLDPLVESILGLGIDEMLELLLLCWRSSFGSCVCSPDWRANRFRTSVREMTPVRRPERTPGYDAAEIDG